MASDPFVIDHALYGGRELDALVNAFTAAGLEPVAGGEHQHDVTHNALLGFADGSYIELISPREPDLETNVRNSFFQGEAGPCGWAVAVEDIAADVARLRDRGMTVDGPSYHERETPTGDVIEWEVAYPGGGEPGRTLPFLIEDHTPRSRRIQPSPSMADSSITGVAELVIGVESLEDTVETFIDCYDTEEPEYGTDANLGLAYAQFPAIPATLTTPRDGGAWLSDRLDAFGDLPWAILLGSDPFEAAVETYPVADPEPVLDRHVAWLPLDSPTGGRVGVTPMA